MKIIQDKDDWEMHVHVSQEMKKEKRKEEKEKKQEKKKLQSPCSQKEALVCVPFTFDIYKPFNILLG